jgi:hypothetical protein
MPKPGEFDAFQIHDCLVLSQFSEIIPKVPRFLQRAEGSPCPQTVRAGDPSLRLKNGYAQDDIRLRDFLNRDAFPAPAS